MSVLGIEKKTVWTFSRSQIPSGKGMRDEIGVVDRGHAMQFQILLRILVTISRVKKKNKKLVSSTIKISVLSNRKMMMADMLTHITSSK